MPPNIFSLFFKKNTTAVCHATFSGKKIMKSARFYITNVFLALCLSLSAQQPQLVKVTYLHGDEVVLQSLTPELLAKLPALNLIERQQTIKPVQRQAVPATVGAVWYQNPSGGITQEPGFATMWFDNVLRVYVWRDFKELVNVTDVYLDFKKVDE